MLRQHRCDVLFGVDVDLRSETSTDLRGDGANLILAKSGHRCDERAQDVRILSGRPDGQHGLARFEVRDDAARLDRVRHQAMVHHSLGDDDLCLRKSVLDCSVVHCLAVCAHSGAARHERHGEVVWKRLVNHGGLAGHRQLRVHDDRERLVLHVDGIDRIAGDVAIARHNDGYRFARVADDIHGNGAMGRRRKRRRDRQRFEHRCDLRAGEHGLYALHRSGRSHIDRSDPAVRDVAALECDVLHACDLHVVNVRGAALDEARILTPFDARADELRQNGSRSHIHLRASGAELRAPSLAAAFWMALTMC